MTALSKSDLSKYMSELAMRRAQLCRLATLLLTYPDAALKQAFAEGPLWDQCVGLARVLEDEVLAGALERARAGAAAQSEEWFRALRVEHTRFFGQVPVVVSPYGAQYVNGTVSAAGAGSVGPADEEVAVRRHYAWAGIVLRKVCSLT